MLDRKIKIVRICYLIFSVLFLLTGVFFYLLIRDSNILFFEWFKLNRNDIPFFIQNHNLNDVLVYNIPGGLWALSGVMLIRIVWINKIRICNIYILSFLSIAVFLEVLQLIKNIPGTFDFLDIITMCSFALLEQFIFFTLRRF